MRRSFLAPPLLFGFLSQFENKALTRRHQSGQMFRVKVPGKVNTRRKAALMTAVARHTTCVPQSRGYYDRKCADGKTKIRQSQR